MPERKIDYEKTWKRLYEQIEHETGWSHDDLVNFEESYDKTSDEDRTRHTYKVAAYNTYKSIMDYIEFLDKGRYFME